MRQLRGFPNCLLLSASFFLAPVTVHAQGEDLCPSGSTPDAAASGDYGVFEGRTIAAIKYLTVPVFDPEDPRENNALYRFLNSIHVDTRDQVIADQLLFEVGDAVDSRTMAETERLLRTRPYLNNASIRVTGDCGEEGVVVLVTVRDVWTLEPQISIGREGGETQHGFGFSEENLFGLGNAVFIGYDKNADRSSIDYGFFSPHLFGSRLSATLRFADSSDGQQTIFELTHPFYSLEAPWAAGINNRDLSVVDIIRYQDDQINAYRHQSAYHEAFVGVAVDVSASRTRRILMGLAQDKEDFSANEDTLQGVPDDFNRIYPWVEYRSIENRYAVYTNLNQLHQVEDVSVGADWRVRLGHGGSYWGNNDEFSRLELDYTDMVDLSPEHLLQLHLNAGGVYYSGDSTRTEAVIGGGLGYYYLVSERHRWYASASYHQGHQLPQHAELTAGGGGGLRGYPLDFQRGNKRLLATLEKRYISDIHLFNVLRFGTAMYLDVGRAWGGGYTRAPYLANVGVGIRMSSSKAKVGNVLHLDLAVPLVERSRVNSFQWVIRATQNL